MFSYICLLVVIIFFSVLLLLLVDFFDKIKIFKIVTNFEKYLLILEYHMQKAYDIIYKDRILIYSLEAVRVNDIDFNIISKDFALLVLKLVGPNLKNEFVNLYGNEETFMFVLMEYFNSKFEDDEIRKKAEDNLMEDGGESKLML